MVAAMMGSVRFGLSKWLEGIYEEGAGGMVRKLLSNAWGIKMKKKRDQKKQTLVVFSYVTAFLLLSLSLFFFILIPQALERSFLTMPPAPSS